MPDTASERHGDVLFFSMERAGEASWRQGPRESESRDREAQSRGPLKVGLGSEGQGLADLTVGGRQG